MALQLIDLGNEVEVVEIDTSKVPYTFSVKLTDKTYTFTVKYNISIHVPLAGHDFHDDLLDVVVHISIHVPLAGHDCKKAQRLLCIFVKTG